MENLASEAETAAVKGQLSIVYRIPKQLSGPRNTYTKRVMDKQGSLLTIEREQVERWAQQFEEVLNGPEPEDPADQEPLEDIVINTDPLSHAES